MATQLPVAERQTGDLLAAGGRSTHGNRNAFNPRVLILAFASFAIGTGVFVVTGLLGGVAESFTLPLETAGHLATVYAVAYAVLAPVLVAATGRVARRRLLVAVLFSFALANLAAAAAPTFTLLLISRVAAACCAAICTPVATAVAAGIVAPEHRGRALSAVIGGASASWVVGVPLGTALSDAFGWRASFVLVALLAAVATAGVGALLPNVNAPAPTGPLISRLAVAGRPAVVVTLAVTVLGMTASFTALTYVRPLLEDLAGLGGGGVASMLLLFGVAGIAGSVIGGRAADRRGYRGSAGVILVALALSLLIFSLLRAVGAGPALATPGAGVALVVLAVSGFALMPVQQNRLIQAAPDEQNGALALNASAIYAGQGMGAAIGSLVLWSGSTAALGYAGAACAVVALAVALIPARPGARRPPEPRPVPRVL